MKFRIEKFGLHYFDRDNGLHFLIDEVKPKIEELSIAPRTFSIAITDDCNAKCQYCHVPKGKNYLKKEFLLKFCHKIDALGCLDIALGGGEPLLHPEIATICESIWTETELGISITTNGQLLNPEIIEDLYGKISFIRVSLDSVNPIVYKNLRNFNFLSIKKNLSMLNGKIPFGINIVVNSQTIKELDDILDFVKCIGAEELLLLPMIVEGQLSLSKDQFQTLELWINKHYLTFPIRVLEQARKVMNIPTLFENDSYYSDYLYLSARQFIQNNSYEKSGEEVTLDNIDTILKKWRRRQSTVYNSTYM